jgi:hypothetical protein
MEERKRVLRRRRERRDRTEKRRGEKRRENRRRGGCSQEGKEGNRERGSWEGVGEGGGAGAHFAPFVEPSDMNDLQMLRYWRAFLTQRNTSLIEM